MMKLNEESKVENEKIRQQLIESEERESKLEMFRLEGLRTIAELKNQLETAQSAQEGYKNQIRILKESYKGIDTFSPMSFGDKEFTQRSSVMTKKGKKQSKFSIKITHKKQIFLKRN